MEHIFPQTAKHELVDFFPKAAPNVKAPPQPGNQLGNLTVLESTLQNAAGNRMLKGKWDNAYFHSIFSMVSAIPRAPVFDRELFERRQQALVDHLLAALCPDIKQYKATLPPGVRWLDIAIIIHQSFIIRIADERPSCGFPPQSVVVKAEAEWAQAKAKCVAAAAAVAEATAAADRASKKAERMAKAAGKESMAKAARKEVREALAKAKAKAVAEAQQVAKEANEAEKKAAGKVEAAKCAKPRLSQLELMHAEGACTQLLRWLSPRHCDRLTAP